jgi:hypothetical protein
MCRNFFNTFRDDVFGKSHVGIQIEKILTLRLIKTVISLSRTLRTFIKYKLCIFLGYLLGMVC